MNFVKFCKAVSFYTSFIFDSGFFWFWSNIFVKFPNTRKNTVFFVYSKAKRSFTVSFSLVPISIIFISVCPCINTFAVRKSLYKSSDVIVNTGCCAFAVSESFFTFSVIVFRNLGNKDFTFILT